MSRVYWDTMLFIYLLEDHPQFGDRVEAIYERMQLRGDVLCTSYLGLGEILTGAQKSPERLAALRSGLETMKIEYLPFDGGAVETFAWLRAVQRLATADSIHLACAASRGIDLFLTGDRQLARQIVPGIQFIAAIENSPI